MTAIRELPLTPRPQTLTCELGGTTYLFRFKWNRIIQAWVMDIRDSAGLPIAGLAGLDGIPLVTGTDLLGQFRYLAIGGGLPMIVMTIAVGRSPDEVPNFRNLGTDGHVFFQTPT
jgi:hypothetical protein